MSARITPVLAEQWADMIRQGLPPKEASEHFNESRQAFRMACRRYAIEYPRKKHNRFNEAHKRSAVNKYNHARRSGSPVSIAERKSGHTSSTIRSWARALGIGTVKEPRARTWWETQALFFFGDNRDLFGNKL